MRTLRRQRGFLLNPYRFAGTVQSGAMVALGSGTVTLGGASVVAATAAASGSGIVILANDQAADGAFSAAGSGASTFAGALIAATAASATGTATASLNAASSSVEVDAARFDGSDTLQANSAMGLADSKKGILSAWLYFEDTAFNSVFTTIDTASSTNLLQMFMSAGKVEVFAVTTSGTTVIDMQQDTGKVPSISTGRWYHVLAAWDVSSSTRQLYINDTEALGTVSSSNNNIQYSASDNWKVGNSARLGMAELYIAPGQYIDISAQENRRKFIDTNGKPVDLGPTGAIPTGTAPAIYLHLADGETANNFAINRGAGGTNFTVTGALTTYASSPSD